MALPVRYKGVCLDCGYRIDLVVEDLLILELKCVEHMLPVHDAQLLTYLKLTGKRVGLILNFMFQSLPEAESFERFFDFRSPCLRVSVVK